jgi:thiol-disulfide isomerase/thioredoxin
MKLRRNLVLICVFLIPVVLGIFGAVNAQGDSDQPAVVITLFWREGCSHCAEEKPFLQELADQNPQIELREYEVVSVKENLNYFLTLGGDMGFKTTGVPVTVIGDQSWVGYSDAIGSEISAAVDACLINGCGDPAEKFGIDTSNTVNSAQEAAAPTETGSEKTGGLSTQTISMLALAALLLVVYGVGSLLRKNKSKPTRKRH